MLDTANYHNIILQEAPSLFASAIKTSEKTLQDSFISAMIKDASDRYDISFEDATKYLYEGALLLEKNSQVPAKGFFNLLRRGLSTLVLPGVGWQKSKKFFGPMLEQHPVATGVTAGGAGLLGYRLLKGLFGRSGGSSPEKVNIYGT